MDTLMDKTYIIRKKRRTQLSKPLGNQRELEKTVLKNWILSTFSHVYPHDKLYCLESGSYLGGYAMGGIHPFCGQLFSSLP